MGLRYYYCDHIINVYGVLYIKIDIINTLLNYIPFGCIGHPCCVIKYGMLY